MNVAFFNGVSGMVAYQQDLDQLSHNMANVNTVAYKPSRTAFADLLYTRMKGRGSTANSDNAAPAEGQVEADQEGEPITAHNWASSQMLVGHGVRAAASERVMTQGAMQQTGNELDFAVMGEGFFAVQHGGDISYTRNGAFTVGVEGNKGMLVTADGGYVLDASGKPIELQVDEDTGSYLSQGVSEALGIYTFDNPYGLQPTTGSAFYETDLSGAAQAVKAGEKDRPYKLVSGALEASAVELSQTMVDVMKTQKAFQFNARIVQMADQLDEVINNLR